MGNTGAILGGLILISGGIAYYLYKKGFFNGNGYKTCPEYLTQSDCISHNCYWYNNRCNTAPPPSDYCTGQCFYEGLTDCDSYNNKCKCVDGQWTLFETNSVDCVGGNEYNTCFPSYNNIATCLPIPGIGVNTCSDGDIGFSTGCLCGGSLLCDDLHFCEPRVNRCLWNMGVNVSADNTNWSAIYETSQVSPADCGGISGGRTCDFDLGGEFVASKLIGTFSWEAGLPLIEVYIDIYGYLEGAGWNKLGETLVMPLGGEGSTTIQWNFTKQGISKIRFGCCSPAGVSTKPKSFYGDLMV